MIFLVIRFRTNRLIVFSVLFFVLSVFFLLRVNPDYLVVVDLVADRFMYLPSLGLCCLAGAYADKGLSKTHRVGLRNIFIMVLIVMASALMVKTFNQCRVWKDTLTLWKHILTHAPKTTFGYISRGTYYDEHNQLDLALADYDRAIELLPAYLKTYVRRGIVYGKRNQYDLALNDFNRVISVRPDDAIALSNRGNVYKLKGDCALAVEDYSRALQIDPNQ
jgi:tetratricopeptide (TPR) repeat protein